MVGVPAGATLLAVPASVTAGATATVSGAVYDGVGDPVAGTAVVLAAGAGTLAAASLTTGADGSFSTVWTAPGSPGAVALTATVQGSAVSAGTVALVTAAGVSVAGTTSAAIPSPPPSGSPVTVGGPGSGTPDTSVAVAGLNGDVAVSEYGGNPEPGATLSFTGGGTFFDVGLADATLTASASLTVSRCAGAAAGDAFYWWNGTAWQPVSPAAVFSGVCLSVTLSGSSSPPSSSWAGRRSWAARQPRR